MRRIAPALLAAVVLTMAVGTAGADWQLQAPPEPAGADNSYVYDFSCDRDPAMTDLCTAVGMTVDSEVETPLVARWQAGRWALQSASVPREAVDSRFQGISCPDATACNAVGSYTTEAGEFSLAERWNGTSWSVQRTVNPAEATTTKLNDVGCWIIEGCTAVGYAIIRSVRSAIAERWNGSTWTLQSISLPEGATSSEFTGATCRSTTYCVAVGRYTERSGRVLALGAAWNGTSWSVTATATPTGATSTYLNSISCLETGTCIAVGGYIEASGVERTLVENWNGRAWSQVTSPNPAGSRGSVLRGVSCTIGNLCAAVGTSVESGGNTVTLGLRWNGAEWSRGREWLIDEAPSLTGSRSSNLTGVVCDAATCQAAGYAYAGSRYAPLGARDDEVPSWVLKTLPRPVSNETLSDITCFSENGCFAVGTGASRARMLSGGAGSWIFYGELIPSRAVYSQLRGVDCVTSPYFCTTVGVYNVEGGLEMPYAFTDIDSGEWDPKTVPTPGGASAALNEVSCASSTACMAVGDFKEAGVPKAFATFWNGTAWSTKTALNAASSETNVLMGVSCLSSTDCIAAGYALVSGSYQPLVERWNGTSWTLHTSPLPEGASSGRLLGVSCAASTCMAVGESESGSYVVRWNGSGTTWTVEAAPLPAFATADQLEDVSCTSATACTAVGWYDLPGGARESLAASWDGTDWQIQLTPNPGTSRNVLLGVSCISATVCRTAGWSSSGGESVNFVAITE